MNCFLICVIARLDRAIQKKELDSEPAPHPLIKSEGMLDAGVKPENDRINLF